MLFALFLAATPASQPDEWKQTYLINKAWDAFSHKRTSEAEQLFKSVLKTQPTNEVALVHLAVIAKEKGDLETAANYLRTAVKANPSSFQAQFHLGVVWLAMRRYEEAAVSFNAAARADPKNIDARVNAGDAYELFGKGEQARAAYASALAIDPKNAWAHRQLGNSAFKAKLLPLAIEHLRAAREGFPKDYSVPLALGHAETALGNDAAALEAYTAAAQLQPNQSATHAFVGTALERMGRRALAEKAFRQAIHVQPNDPLARTLLGNLLRADGRTIQARREYESALRSNKDYVWALAELGSLMLESGEVVKASRLLERAQKLAPNNDDIEMALGDIAAIRHRHDEAATHYRRVLGRAPLHLGAMVKLGAMLMNAGRVADAQKIFRRAVDAYPTSSWALISLADSERVLHDYGGAEKHLRQALEVDPKSSWARRQLGYTLFEAHKPLQAREELLLAEAAYPQEASIPVTLGHVARMLQETDAAQKYYERARTLAPKDGQIRMFQGVLEQERKRYVQAIERFDEATTLDPKLFDAHVLRGDAAALVRKGALEPAAEPESQPSSFASSQPATYPDKNAKVPPKDAALADRMYKVAKVAYRKALALKPDAPWPARQLAFLELDVGHVKEAAPLLAAAQKGFPADIEVALGLGHAERRQQKPKEALGYYENAIAIAPTDTRGYVFAAIVLRELERYDASYARLTEAIAADNTSAQAYFERALTSIAAKRPASALADADQATRLDWSHRSAWLIVGRLRHDRKELDEAVNAYGIATSLGAPEPHIDLAYASALRDRGRFGDLAEATDRVERAVEALPNESFANLVAGHILRSVSEAKARGEKTETVEERLRGEDRDVPLPDAAARRLLRAVSLAPDNHVQRLSAAHSLVALGKKAEAKETLRPIIEAGEAKCPAREWDLTFSIETNRKALIAAALDPAPDSLVSAEASSEPSSQPASEPRAEPASQPSVPADITAVAFLLMGDLSTNATDNKQARLYFACSVAHQANRPEAHVRLGAAYESDAFLRFAEEHYALASRLATLILDADAATTDRARAKSRAAAALRDADLAASRPASIPSSEPASLPESPSESYTELRARPAEVAPADETPALDDHRRAELKVVRATSDEAIGRLRKEGGFPVAPMLRLSGEIGFRSQQQYTEIVERTARILAYNGGGNDGQALLALTVPRTLELRAIASWQSPEIRVLPRLDLEYRFFRDEGTFVNDQQVLQTRLGHDVSLRAVGRLPLRIPKLEVAYWLSEGFTIASSPARGEIHSTTSLTVAATVTQVGSATLQLVYDAGFFNPDPTSVADRKSNTFVGSLRLEPVLRKWNVDAGLEYRVEATGLWPSLATAQGHALLLNAGWRIREHWYVAGDLRFGFAASTQAPATVPTIFSYAMKARGGYLFGREGAAFATFAFAGTPSHTYDTVTVGTLGQYRLVWPKVTGVTHSGFFAYASYELRIAYNLGNRLDHFVSAGLSFAR